MLFSKNAAAMAAGFIAVLSAATLAQNPAPADLAPAASPAGDVLVLDELATLEWIEKADVASLHEGVLERMELKIGMPVKKGGPIGYHNSKSAELTVTKAKVAVENVATQQKAVAQKQLALAVLAVSKRLDTRGQGFVPKEEIRKNEAEVKVADAMEHEAIEKRALDKADLDLAQEAREEHIIRAPFDGVVYERMKNPGESVRANESVVRLGNLDRLRAWAYVPLDYVFRVKEGQDVEIQLRLQGTRSGPLPIEQKKFRGKITFVDPQIAAVAETAVRIYSEFENPNHELRPGFKAQMTIYLNNEGDAPAPRVGARPAPAGFGR